MGEGLVTGAWHLISDYITKENVSSSPSNFSCMLTLREECDPWWDTGTAAAKFKRQWLWHAQDLVLLIPSLLLFAFEFCPPLSMFFESGEGWWQCPAHRWTLLILLFMRWYLYLILLPTNVFTVYLLSHFLIIFLNNILWSLNFQIEDYYAFTVSFHIMNISYLWFVF